jgi:hypothetical protein
MFLLSLPRLASRAHQLEGVALLEQVLVVRPAGSPARRARVDMCGLRGGQWNASTINGNRRRRIGILNNELYLGRILYNRQRFLNDPESGKRIARPNPDGLHPVWLTPA